MAARLDRYYERARGWGRAEGGLIE
jgi:hypothetical protein